MKILIRTVYAALSLATITPVANAAIPDSPAPVVQQDSSSGWVNG